MSQLEGLLDTECCEGRSWDGGLVCACVLRESVNSAWAANFPHQSTYTQNILDFFMPSVNACYRQYHVMKLFTYMYVRTIL